MRCRRQTVRTRKPSVANAGLRYWNSWCRTASWMEACSSCSSRLGSTRRCASIYRKRSPRYNPNISPRSHRMLFMVIERYKNRDAAAVYRRFREKGRMAPEGVRYVDSWVEMNFDRCFQVMECADESLLREWTKNWEDLVEFEIVTVRTSREAADAAITL